MKEVRDCIYRRIAHQHLPLIASTDIVKLTDAIDYVAECVGDVEEIGSSDISCWVKQVYEEVGQVYPH